MKNLQIGDNDLVGNKFNGHDLHLYLNQKGIDSYHLIANEPESKDPKTFQIGDEYSQNLRRLIQEFENKYNIIGGSHLLPFDIIYNKLFLKSDIVHLHLIHNFMFNVNMLPLMTSLKPIVWTLHDPWAMTGHCFHPFYCSKWQNGCGDCPDLNLHFKISKDTTALNWEMKRIAFQNSQLHLIVASEWMHDIVKKSPFFSHCEIDIVPFGINQNIFKPISNIINLKKSLKIDEDSIVLFFRAQKNNIYKGFDYIKCALDKIMIDFPNKAITLLTVGEIFIKKNYPQYKYFDIKEYGWVSDDNFLAQLYQVCDIFLMPSQAEAFGMMAIEAMSCKKPVIVLEDTSLPWVVDAPNAGIAAKRDLEDFYQKLKELIFNKDLRDKHAELCYNHAIKNYGTEDYVEKIIKVYEKAIKNHKPSTNGNFVIEQLLKHSSLKSQQVKENNEIKENLMNNQSLNPLKKTIKLSLFGLIPIFLIKKKKGSKTSFKIFSITILKKKTSAKNSKFYLFGILILKLSMTSP